MYHQSMRNLVPGDRRQERYHFGNGPVAKITPGTSETPKDRIIISAPRT